MHTFNTLCVLFKLNGLLCNRTSAEIRVQSGHSNTWMQFGGIFGFRTHSKTIIYLYIICKRTEQKRHKICSGPKCYVTINATISNSQGSLTYLGASRKGVNFILSSQRTLLGETCALSERLMCTAQIQHVDRGSNQQFSPRSTPKEALQLWRFTGSLKTVPRHCKLSRLRVFPFSALLRLSFSVLHWGIICTIGQRTKKLLAETLEAC